MIETGSIKEKIKNWNKIWQSCNINCLLVSERMIFYLSFLLFIFSKHFQCPCILSKLNSTLALKNKYKNILYIHVLHLYKFKQDGKTQSCDLPCTSCAVTYLNTQLRKGLCSLSSISSSAELSLCELLSVI